MIFVLQTRIEDLLLHLPPVYGYKKHLNQVIKNTCICLICWLVLSPAYAQHERPDADEWFLKARDASHSEHWAEARKICRELLAFYPNYFDASILIGRTFAWELKTDSARMTILPLLDMEPDNYDLLSLLIDNEIWGGQFERALEYTDHALDFYPWDESFLFKKADSYHSLKDNTNAIKVLYELLTLNPEHIMGNNLLNTILPPNKFVDEWYALAGEEAKAGNWKLARNYCRQVLNDDPEHFEASFLIAQTFAFENIFDSARLITVKLFDRYSENFALLKLMIDTEEWNRKYDAALTQVEEALTLFPDHEYFLFKKARIQFLNKDYRNALATLDKLLAINPEHEEGNVLKNYMMENRHFKDYVFVENDDELLKKPYWL